MGLGMRAPARLVALLLAPGAAPGFAQELTKYEQATMYSYLDHVTENAERTSFHGYKWDFSVYADKRLALGMSVTSSQHHHGDLVFGPELRFDRGRLGLRLHARAGIIRRAFSNFGTSMGSSLDFYLGKGFGIRMQPEVILWKGDGLRTDFRLSTGVAMRWGKAR